MPVRSALYVDGFNLYHAVVDLKEPFLKWCDLWRLAEVVVPSKSETVVKVVFCTAYYPGDERKRWRHNQYIAALRAKGVDCVLGHYVTEPKGCYGCGNTWNKPTEKETDINVALSLYHDIAVDVVDKAYLLTADSDQAATGGFLQSNYPTKQLVTVAPPGRKFSSDIERYASGGRIALTRDHIERCVMPATVFDDGRPVARRPREYEPPAGWVHPDRRPK